jgi:hypothetical protein
MRIGIDFDNTIVCYDSLFHRVALERGLIPENLPQRKRDVRQYLRENKKEDLWTELQGYIYGKRMNEAELYPGVIAFIKLYRRKNIPLNIVSHKTKYPFRGPRYNLQGAAQSFLQRNGFHDQDSAGFDREDVFFELTRENKMKRIGQLKCTHFIDDLPEFLSERKFPKNVHRILFDPHGEHQEETSLSRACSWAEVEKLISKEERSLG